ncbi:MAG: transcriptional repressor [Synechococcaceae cyanobacterium SM2_3_60]|nr:transcriptional repressor [Synechococcaceae cyanobacterium SM2_3_60]
MPNQATITQTLKACGLRITPQRYAVYTNLLGRCDHPTAEQILQDLNQDAPTSSQATVYSSLQALRDVGLVREVRLDAGICRYDANMAPHHHFQCQSCGHIEDVPWAHFDVVQQQPLRDGLSLGSYEVIIQGTCCDHCKA